LIKEFTTYFLTTLPSNRRPNACKCVFGYA